MRLRFTLGLCCISSVAFADRVAVLRVDGSAAAQSKLAADVDQAITVLKHERASADDTAKARSTARDGEPDSSSEYVAAGKSIDAQWTLVVHAAPSPGSRVELTACQVATGRTEFLARDVHGSNSAEQIGEMLQRLLRPEGIGSDEMAWKVEPKETARVGSGEGRPAAPAPGLGTSLGTYRGTAPLVIGAGGGAFGALVRPDNARGSSLTGNIAVHIGFVPSVFPSLEIRLNGGASFVGPSAFHADGGARYMAPITGASSVPMFVGPEVTLGIFRPLGGDQSARFLARAAGVLAVQVHSHMQVDVLGEFLVAPGGTGTLLLGGGTVRASLRL